jgi:DNA repair protein RecN (Recombination protein N)
MLQTLRIQNLALVERVAVDFAAGLTVITGETGAGKSILMGALGLLMGERADRTLIRAGEDQCVVEAVLSLKHPARIDALLDEWGLPPCEDGSLILRRTISSSGAGRNLVNDGATTLQVLKKLGDLLVDLHGPHDHQSLFSTDCQMALLDEFGGLADPLDAYVDHYRILRRLEARRRELEGGDSDVAREIEFLSFQVAELDEAGLVEGEDESIEREHKTVAHAGEILELAGRIVTLLSEGEESALNALSSARQSLDRLAALESDQGAAWVDEARQASMQVQELSRALASYAQSVDVDPRRLGELEARMGLYHRLKRKYGISVPELIAKRESLRARLNDLQTRGQQVEEVKARIAEAAAVLARTAGSLSRKRNEAAGRLASAVTRELRDLGFPSGAFSVALTDTPPGPSGANAVEFGFAPNPGEPGRPLRAIASSGEISRVMLAVKTVLAGHDRVPVLIFDEIDANIGGETANAVGHKLAELARTHQVICITHLPQVAVHGEHHFAVTKSVEETRTRTEIMALDEKARTEEIARMLGGRALTSVVLQHAREMLHRPARPTGRTRRA